MAKTVRNGRGLPALELLQQPKKAAVAASLEYVSDQRPGIRRRRAGNGFRYFGASGRPIRDTSTLARIRALVIPPAWSDVWICPSSRGHLQATGRDARGRKQFIYHPRWRAVRDEAKFAHMISFGSALPRIRRRVRRDLASPGMPRQRILAAVVGLLETTLIRVGNEEYVRENDSFGLTTLRNRHAEVHGATIRLRFRGKSGKQHEVGITNPRLARLIKRCQELPGQELFEYLDEEGKPRPIGSGDVNEYLHEISGQHFTAKDFRTWAATILTSRALDCAGPCASATRAERTVVAVVKSVADRLGNTSSVCRKCYIHPAVIAAYLHQATGAKSVRCKAAAVAINLTQRNGAMRGNDAHVGSEHSAGNGAESAGGIARAPKSRSRTRRAEEKALIAFLRRAMKQATMRAKAKSTVTSRSAAS